jgi:hypothetical protein
MPYIKKGARLVLDEHRDKYKGVVNVGELNYIVTTECHKYLERCGQSYRTYNDIIGVLECAKLELYRRFVGPYEDTKINENGDIVTNFSWGKPLC